MGARRSEGDIDDTNSTSFWRDSVLKRAVMIWFVFPYPNEAMVQFAGNPNWLPTIIPFSGPVSTAYGILIALAHIENGDVYAYLGPPPEGILPGIPHYWTPDFTLNMVQYNATMFVLTLIGVFILSRLIGLYHRHTAD